MKKRRIKTNKKNIFYLLVGKLVTYFLVYALILQGFMKLLVYIFDNCLYTI